MFVKRYFDGAPKRPIIIEPRESRPTARSCGAATPKGHNPATFGYFGGDAFIEPDQPRHRLAGNLELALNGSTNDGIATVAVESLAGGQIGDLLCCLLDILEILLRLKLRTCTLSILDLSFYQLLSQASGLLQESAVFENSAALINC